MSMKPRPVPEGWAGPISEWTAALAAGGRRPETIHLRIEWVRRFARDLRAGPWTVGPLSVIEWSGAHDWARDTRRSAHQSVRQFYRWAQGVGYIDVAPPVPSVRQSDPAPRPATLGAIAVARCSDDPRVRLMVRLAAELGMRRGEVARAHTRDLVRDLAGWSLVVHGKGGKTRMLPLPHALADELTQIPSGFFFPGADHGHLSPAWVGKLVGRALPEGTTMHALRHAFASTGFAKTRNLVAVQRALGHASPSTTLRYVLVPDDDVREVVEAVA